MSVNSYEVVFAPDGVIALRTERHYLALGVGVWAQALMTAYTRDWSPAGTTAPGGFDITHEGGRTRVTAGTYLMLDHAKTPEVVIAAPDALNLSLALSAVLRGDPPSRPPKVVGMLLTASPTLNQRIIDAVAAGRSDGQMTSLLATVARLAFRGPLRIVHPRAVSGLISLKLN